MTAPHTSTQVRQNLLDALRIDLVGPDPDSPYCNRYRDEELTQAPSKWYLTGFLAPYGSSLDVRLPLEDEQDNDREIAFAKKEGIEDGTNPEVTAARTVPFPSSIGLSFLLPNTVKEVAAIVSWGDYYPIEAPDTEAEPAEPETTQKRKKNYNWKRVHQTVELSLPLAVSETSARVPIPGHEGVELTIVNQPVENTAFPDGTRTLSVFLVNHRKPEKEHKDTTYLFQAQLKLHCTQGFLPRIDPRQGQDTDPDEQVAALQYRHDYEFAVGHNVAAVATLNPNDRSLCQTISTAWIPTYEVPRVDASNIPGVALGMEALAAIPDSATLQAQLRPLVTAYKAWIRQQSALTPNPSPTPGEGNQSQLTSLTPSSPLVGEGGWGGEGLSQAQVHTAQNLLHQASFASDRISKGIDLLSDPHAFKAFTIANKVIAKARRQQLSQEQGKPPGSFAPPAWRPFQLAFILLNLSGIAQPEGSDRAIVDLLFFPTGGGKTEAYLGLAAFTLVYRRLTHPGIQGAGVSIIMRYTLRLLTLDQLERAARLICALELERQQDKALGDWPFEIGLWIGSGATPNRMGTLKDNPDDKPPSAAALTLAFQRNSKKRSPIPLEGCPWCGTKFDRDSFKLLPIGDMNPKKLAVRCDDYDCEFHDQDLPIVAIDEPLYRRLPCFLIATVDKFAGLPWFGQTGKLFGKVSHYQPGEGFFSSADEKPFGQKLDQGLPPPDLIIQDELHLISGPLGTMVGLYETAIDALCSTNDAKPIRPKVIASTATVRRAQSQIQALFNRSQVQVFPPPGPDRHDSFFAETIPATPQDPGRLYVGVAAQGRSLKVVLLRTYLSLLSAAQYQWEQWEQVNKKPRKKNTDDDSSKNPADPYMTLMGYFNALRELGGSRRIVEDEVVSRLNNYQDRQRVGEALSFFRNRKIADNPEELTSRVDTNKIAETKRKLSLPFTDKERVDVALATNMISVGLDIVRLGLMVILGQPKTAAEYIQSSSRVGRDKNRPGLVVTLMNIHRPRDRSHYERFQYWHQTFYRAVEATSVTPFSSRALDRGLAAVTVALARLGVAPMTPPKGASLITTHRKAIDALVQQIADRAGSHSKGDTSLDELTRQVSDRVSDLLDTWDSIHQNENQGLQYNKSEAEGVGSLLLDAMEVAAMDRKPSLERQKFKAPRSLRDVELSVPLWISDPFNAD